MAAVRILGIDPGTVVVGFACLEVQEREGSALRAPTADRPLARRVSNLVQRASAGGGSTRLIEAGAWKLGRNRPIGERLARLAEEIEAVIARHEPDELALEEAYIGRSVQSALRIGEARGVILAAAARAGLDLHQYPPARIKRSVTGSGAADKESVARMAAQTLGQSRIDGPADVSDAVAVALCRVEQRRASIRFSGA